MIDYMDYINFPGNMNAKTRFYLSHFFKKIPACQKLRLKANGIKVTKKKQISNEN